MSADAKKVGAKVVVPAGAVSSQDIQVTNPYGVTPTYANEAGMGFTLSDVRLIFTEVGPDPMSATGSAEKTLKANIVIPINVAEALAAGLTMALEHHKKNLESLQNAQQSAKSQS